MNSYMHIWIEIFWSFTQSKRLERTCAHDIKFLIQKNSEFTYEFIYSYQSNNFLSKCSFDIFVEMQFRQLCRNAVTLIHIKVTIFSKCSWLLQEWLQYHFLAVYLQADWTSPESQSFCTHQRQRRMVATPPTGSTPPLYQINELCSKGEYFWFFEWKLRVSCCVWLLLSMDGFEIAASTLCSVLTITPLTGVIILGRSARRCGARTHCALLTTGRRLPCVLMS